MVDVLFVKSFSNSQRPAMSRLDTPSDILETATFLFALSCHFVSCASFWHDCRVVLSQQTRTHPVNDLADNGSCTLFNTDPQKKKQARERCRFQLSCFTSCCTFHHYLLFCWTQRKWMDEKKNPIVFLHSLFFLFSTAALMVNGLLFAGHECLMMEEVFSLFFL